MEGLAAQPPEEEAEASALEMYKLAIEESRFQVDFNWKRTQYLLTLNVGMLAAGIALLRVSDTAAGLMFAVGALAAIMAMSVVHTQHDYYRAARNRMKRIEAALQLPAEFAVDTTSTMGGRKRTISVNQMLYVLLGILAATHLFGIGLAIAR